MKKIVSIILILLSHYSIAELNLPEFEGKYELQRVIGNNEYAKECTPELELQVTGSSMAASFIKNDEFPVWQINLSKIDKGTYIVKEDEVPIMMKFIEMKLYISSGYS